MITTVTLNPAIDKVIEINNMSLGSVHRVDREVVSFGGKSINVARILTGYGCETEAICFLGAANEQEVRELSRRDGLRLNTILLEGKTRTNLKIIEPDQAYRTTDINEAGFMVSEMEYAMMLKVIDDASKRSDFMVLSGSLPKGVHSTFYKEISLMLGDKVKVIIDADGETLLAALEGSPYMIKPNNHELEAVVGRPLPTLEDIVDVGKEMIRQYGITYVLVSRGADGSVLIGEQVVLVADILPVKVLSTVGAGDSMLGGMIYGLQEGDASLSSLKKALSYGVASSSIAIGTQDHRLIQVNEMKEKAAEVVITEG